MLGLDGRRRSVGWICWATECQELSVDEVANLGGEVEEAEVIFAIDSRKKSVSVILEMCRHVLATHLFVSSDSMSSFLTRLFRTPASR